MVRLNRRPLIALTAIASITLLWPTSAAASHFRYGSLTWKQRSDLGSNYVEFALTAGFRRNGFVGSDTDGYPQVGDTISEVIGATGINFGDGVSTGMLDFKVVAVDRGQNWFLGTAVDGVGDPILHQYATPNNGGDAWLVSAASCCRISSCTQFDYVDTTGQTSVTRTVSLAHINNSDGYYRVWTTVDLDKASSSAVTSLPAVVGVTANGPVSFSVPATDSEANDHYLRWRLAYGAEAADSGLFTQPSVPTASAASIVPNTGEYKWNTAGAVTNTCSVFTSNPLRRYTYYSTQVIVEKYKNSDTQAVNPVNSIAVDFFLSLGESTFTPPVFDDSGSSSNAAEIVGEVAGQITFYVQGSATTGTCTINHAGLPTGATFVITSPGNPTTGVFDWTPGAGTEGVYVITFSLVDGNGIQSTPRSYTLRINAQGSSEQPACSCPGTFTVPGCAAEPFCITNTGGGTLQIAAITMVDQNSQSVIFTPSFAALDLLDGVNDGFISLSTNVSVCIDIGCAGQSATTVTVTSNATSTGSSVPRTSAQIQASTSVGIGGGSCAVSGHTTWWLVWPLGLAMLTVLVLRRRRVPTEPRRPWHPQHRG